MDRITLAGNATSPLGGAPVFPAGSFLDTVPMQFSYHVPITLGSGAQQEVLLDTGAGGESWVVWSGCTTSDCAGHPRYTPSTGANFFNFSYVDTETFGSGQMFEAWRVNDTAKIGNISAIATFGAAFSLAGPQGLDGNINMAKGFFIAGKCVQYPNFVEDAFVSGAIKNPVLAFYQLAPNDVPASGVTSVAQIGGIDRNKFTGSIDWIPMNQQSMWQSPSQIRTVKVSSNSTTITPAFNHPIITFDTGDPGLLGIPTDDWIIFTNALGATQDSNGAWWFPCGSTLSLMMNGNTGRTYVVPLADTTNQQNGKCAALGNDSGTTDNWIMGAPFLDQYYLVFHYQANVMGLGTKNLAASAATTSVFIGQA